MTIPGRFTPWLLVIIGLAGLAGCGGPAAVISGSVSYEGQPVNDGCITLLPADGRGPACGGAIADGKYRVEVVSAGRKKVQIVGVKKINFARSTEDMAQAAKTAQKTPDATGIIERADTVPADAEGNNVEVDVVAGNQTLDFQLKRPPAAKPGPGRR